MTPPCAFHAVVVVSDSSGGPTQRELVTRLHGVLSNNRDVSTCTVLSVIDGHLPCSTAGERGFLLDRRLVSKRTCSGALRAVLENVAQQEEMAVVVGVVTSNDLEEVLVSGVKSMTLSYGFKFLRLSAGDDVLRDVIRVTAWITSVFTSCIDSRPRDIDSHEGVTLVAMSRMRMLDLSPHLPLTKYFFYDLENCAPDESIPAFVSASLVKASDFLVRIEPSTQGHQAVTPFFSPAFDVFCRHTNIRNIRWIDTLPAMSVVFDRHMMGAMMDAIATAANERGLRMTVKTARSWMILGHESDIMDISYPCLIKSRAACGVPESHQMALVLRQEGMHECEMEGQLVAQEFINHSGVVFKVYVGKNGFDVVQRGSMPDIGPVSDDMPSIIEFDSLHGLPTRFPWDSSPDDAMNALVVPDDEFFAEFVQVARDVVQLSVFGFDVLVHGGNAVVIDINYLPRLFDGAL